MDLAHQRRLTIGLAAIVALILGWQIANREFLLAGVLLLLLVPWLIGRIAGVGADVLLAGAVLFGYLVGNRGFAQLHAPGIPLLPGEALLAFGGLVLFWRSAREQMLPILKDPLNLALVAWLVLGLLRLYVDWPLYRFTAVRDFALVYYAGFFFLAQAWARDERARRALGAALTAGFALSGPVLLVFTWWPDVLIDALTLGNTPLIFVKSDVAGGLVLAGALRFMDCYDRSGRRWWLLLAAANLGVVALSNSRAAIVAAGVVVASTVVLRRWRWVRMFSGFAAAGAFVLLVAALVQPGGWRETTLYRLGETGLSILDLRGDRTYSDALADKGDNNQFRLVWWRTVIDETLQLSPWTGLGFGHDLTRRFAETYYGIQPDDLSARSPHNVLVTVFARLGTIGLLLLLTILAAAARQFLLRQTQGDDKELALWLGAAAIFVTACFGVVLEGPMGAALFWTLLGLANGRRVPAMAAIPATPAHPAPAAEPFPVSPRQGLA